MSGGGVSGGMNARRLLPIVALLAALGWSILPATAPSARAAATDLTVTT